MRPAVQSRQLSARVIYLFPSRHYEETGPQTEVVGYGAMSAPV
jgi:hypothetical protein